MNKKSATSYILKQKIKGLKCRECGKLYPAVALHVCEFCFGPLEVDYNYDEIKKHISRERIENGPKSLWRYADLLPVEGPPTVGLYAGFTPLIEAKNLGAELGLKKLYIKNDTVNHPTLSFKDRVVAIAITRAMELGFTAVACASTGNLANSVAACAAEARLRCYVFIPGDLEAGKILGSLIYAPTVVAVEGNYDDVNRLCSEVAGEYQWAFVNINIRPYFAEGCAPVASAFKEGRDFIKPVKPKTIAKSIAIGNPADGYYALKAVHESKGNIDAVSDAETVDGIKLLARTEGIFAETAGGVTIAVLKKVVMKGLIPRDGTVVG